MLSSTSNLDMFKHQQTNNQWWVWIILLITSVVFVGCAHGMAWFVPELLFYKFGAEFFLLLYEIPLVVLVGVFIGQFIPNPPIIALGISGVLVLVWWVVGVLHIQTMWEHAKILLILSGFYILALWGGITYIKHYPPNVRKALIVISFLPGVLLSSWSMLEVTQPPTSVIYEVAFDEFVTHLSRKYVYRLPDTKKAYIVFDASHLSTWRIPAPLIFEVIQQFLFSEGLLGIVGVELYPERLDVMEFIPHQGLKFVVTSSVIKRQYLSETYEVTRLSERTTQVTLTCQIHRRWKTFRQRHLEDAFLHVLDKEIDNNEILLQYAASTTIVKFRRALNIFLGD